MASNVDDLSDCLSESPLLQNIIALFEQCIVSNLPRMNEADMAEARASKLRDFENSLRELKTRGSKLDREQFFRYLLPFYLKGDITPIARKFSNSEMEKSPPIMKPPFQKPKSQTALMISGGYRNRTSMSVSSKPMIDPTNFRRISEDALIKKIFLNINYFSSAYVPLFIETVQAMMVEDASFGQTTINRFLSDKNSRFLNTPLAQRILYYINKSGSNFLDGIAGLPIHSPHATQNSDRSFKSLLVEYFGSDQGRQIFPQWFRGLDPPTQEKAVLDLLSKIP
jgi:hypothetical protein